MLLALHVLRSALYTQCRAKNGRKKQKKSEVEAGVENELLSEQVRIAAPIFPVDTLEEVTTELYGYVACQFSDLLKTFGLLSIGPKTEKYLKRQESHVSEDNIPYRRGERRLTHIAGFKELLDVVAGEQTISHLIAMDVLYEAKWFLPPKLKTMRIVRAPMCS